MRTHTVLSSTFLKSLLVKSKGIKFIGKWRLCLLAWPWGHCQLYLGVFFPICSARRQHQQQHFLPVFHPHHWPSRSVWRWIRHDLIQTSAFPQEVPVPGVNSVLQTERLVPDGNWNELLQNLFALGTDSSQPLNQSSRLQSFTCLPWESLFLARV